MFSSIRRTPYQTLGSLMILFFTLFLTLFFFTMTTFVYGILSYIESRPQVVAYFNTSTEESEIFQIREEIENSGKIRSVTYVSQEEALGIYRELNKDNPLLLEMVSESILPASLEIFTQRPEQLAEIAELLEGKDTIDEVIFQQSIVDTLVALTTAVRKTSIAVFIFLMIMTIVVLITTTAFKISQNRLEIELKQLLGATRWYIRWPFLKEGIFFGFTSGTIAFLTFYGLIFYFDPFFSSYLQGIPKLSFYGLSSYNLFVYPPSPEFIGLTYIATIIFGMTIGYIGNYIATSKYIS